MPSDSTSHPNAIPEPRLVHCLSLEAALHRCCDSLRAWDGTLDLPSNVVLLLERDRRNRALFSRWIDLSLEVLARVRLAGASHPLLHEVARSVAWCEARQLLGLDRGSPAPTTLEAIVVRELAARTIEPELDEQGRVTP